jgi:hypothetical protein
MGRKPLDETPIRHAQEGKDFGVEQDHWYTGEVDSWLEHWCGEGIN